MMKELFDPIQDKLISMVLFDPIEKDNLSKIDFRVFFEKTNKKKIQKEWKVGNQAFHKNLDFVVGITEAINLFDQGKYRQMFIQTTEEKIHLIKKQEKIKIRRTAEKIKTPSLLHNRKKRQCYQEGVPVPFLIRQGLMNQSGQIQAKQQFKFRQINRFLELVLPFFEDQLKQGKKRISCLDIGCGKAYLTFALYDQIAQMGFDSIEFIGIDRKEEVIKNNQNLARDLGFHHLQFVCTNIAEYSRNHPIDVVIALHACDIATDEAIALGINQQAQALFLAPCCHQNLLHQIKNQHMHAFLKYGILKERFSALLTDALRAGHLEQLGYQVEIIEFVDREDSLKNLMIRAVKQVNPKERSIEKELLELKKLFQVHPWLDQKS